MDSSDIAIRNMIKETDGDCFENVRSLNQELSFDMARKEFNLQNIEFELKQMRTLKLIDNDGLYNNLALLLSDQCVHTIKVAVFQDNDQMIFKDRREFSGSLMKQMNDVYDYIDFHNKTHASIEKLYRNDVRDYPEIAIREALLNLLVHRDYSFSSSAMISIFNDRIEFISIGGLVKGIELEDIMMGISICRNQNLANIFYRLHLIEAYGTGIAKMNKAYEGMSIKPIIETTKNTFKITLYNINTYRDKRNVLLENNKYIGVGKMLNSGKEIILDYIRKNGYITKNDVVKLLNVSPSTAIRLIRQMIDDNHLIQCGKARNTYYISEK